MRRPFMAEFDAQGVIWLLLGGPPHRRSPLSWAAAEHPTTEAAGGAFEGVNGTIPT